MCLLIGCVVFYAIYMPYQPKNNHFEGPNLNGFELLDMESKATAPPVETIKNIDKNALSDIMKPLEYPIKVYIKALQRSVRVLTVPRGKMLNQALQDCEKYRQPPLINHQHSLEFRFPYALSQMQAIARKHNKPQFDFLYENTTTEPLFYFLQSYQYYIVYCSYDKRNKESWVTSDRYINKLATYTINTKDFKRNAGLDFMVPASHPKSGPMGAKYTDQGIYQRQAFLRTDMDWNGYTPKDIIVPYYVPITPPTVTIMRPLLRLPVTSLQIAGAINKIAPPPDPVSQDSWFLFFAGGKNPPGGLREQLEKAIDELARTEHLRDIIFTTSAYTREQFSHGLHHSVFCASVRGDTASSSRLFAVIEAGCIPVIISDWMPLPFSDIIDYTKFSVRFPESIVHDVRQLVAHLRAIPSEQVRAMQAAVRTARTLLVYPPNSQVTEYYLLNPVTLTLVEMFMRRKEYCDGLDKADLARPTRLRKAIGSAGVSDMSNMCSKLYTRLRQALMA